MRTTFNAINRNTKYVIENRYSELAKLQRKLATGKELNRPSDAPVDVVNVLKLKTQTEQLEQQDKNIEDARAWMNITDTAMMSMNSLIQRGRELAIQADSDTLSTEQRSYIAEEVGQIVRQTISIVNTRYKGDYIFSGSHTDKSPAPSQRSEALSMNDYADNKVGFFDGSGGVIGSTFQLQAYEDNGTGVLTDSKRVIPSSLTISGGGFDLEEGVDYKMDYQDGKITLLSADSVTALAKDFTPGNGNYNQASLELNYEYVGQSRDLYGGFINTGSEIIREIESDVTVKVNTTYADLQVDSSTDIIASLIDLGDSLLKNDQPSIRDAIDSIDLSFDAILSAQSSNGSRINLVDKTQDRNGSQQLAVGEIRTSLEDADYAEVVTDYSIAQTVFNAALQSTAQIIQTSLTDFIR